MSTKKMAYNMIDKLTEGELNATIVILKGMTKGNENRIKSDDTEKYQTVSDKEVTIVSKKLISKNLEVCRELANR